MEEDPIGVRFDSAVLQSRVWMCSLLKREIEESKA
jgi:hypothetical protein